MGVFNMCFVDDTIQQNHWYFHEFHTKKVVY